MYWEEEVLVPGGGTPTEVVLWEGEAIADTQGKFVEYDLGANGGRRLQRLLSCKMGYS
jgi:hypothetical protein